MVPYCAWREETMFIPEQSLRNFRVSYGRKGREKRLKRPIIREYHRHRGPQRTETTHEKQYQAQTTKKTQQKVSKKREFLRKIIESSVF
jgi:hypothetical protein